MTARGWRLGVALLVLAGEVGHAQQARSVLGSRFRIDRSGVATLTGELLAVERDSVWLLTADGAAVAVPIADVTRARVPQQGLTANGVLTWALIGGAVSGVALAAACSSEGGDCGAVLPGVMLAWGLFGGVSALVAGPGWRSVGIAADSLRPYARFPQGLPAGFLPESTPPLQR